MSNDTDKVVLAVHVSATNRSINAIVEALRFGFYHNLFEVAEGRLLILESFLRATLQVLSKLLLLAFFLPFSNVLSNIPTLPELLFEVRSAKIVHIQHRGEIYGASNLCSGGFGPAEFIRLLPEEPHLLYDDVGWEAIQLARSLVGVFLTVTFGCLSDSIMQVGGYAFGECVDLDLWVSADDAGKSSSCR